MVWKSWGRRLLLSAAVLLCSAAAAAAGDVSLSLTSAPPRISTSPSAVFAFRAVQSSGWTCGDCAITCKLDGERRSDCGGNGNGTEVVTFAGLKDGNHTFAACATPRSGSGSSAGPTCATYAWDVGHRSSDGDGGGGVGLHGRAQRLGARLPERAVPGRRRLHVQRHLLRPHRVRAWPCGAVHPGGRRARPAVLRRRVGVAGRGLRAHDPGDAQRVLHRRGRPPLPEELQLELHPPLRQKERFHEHHRQHPAEAPADPGRDEGGRGHQQRQGAEDIHVLCGTGDELVRGDPRRSHRDRGRADADQQEHARQPSKISSTAVVTVACDTSSVISRQGTPVYSSQPFTFLYDTRRPSVKLATSTVRTSSHTIPVLIKFEKPVFNFTSSAVQLSGGKLLSFHEASKSIYTMQILAVDKLVSVQVAENTAQDVAGNPNLPSDRLQVRHYSVPASSSSIATIATVIFAATAILATLLTISTSSLIASGAMARPSSYSISEPSRNLLRMACHIQIFALSRWLSINLPVEYYELAKGIEWTIPYIRLPWEGPSADPFVGYSTMPAIAYSELVDRSDVIQADPYYPGAAPGGQQQQITPMQIPVEGKPPAIPLQIQALDGKPLTAMEYRSFFENQDMKPEAQIIMKLQDLDGWKYFGRNMLWLGVIGGGLILLHLLLLLYLRLRYRGGTGKYGALVLPRFEIMLAILAMPCISQASAALIRGGTTGGLAVGIVLIGILTAFLVALLLFLSLGITTGRLLQYKEVHQEGQEHRWYQEIVRRSLGPGKRGQWTWKDPARAARLVKLGPLFEDLRGPPKYMLTQIVVGGGGKRAAADQRIMASEDENEDAEAPVIQKVFGILRIYYTFLESVKRVALGIVAGAHASSGRSSRAHAVVVLAVASFQLFFMLLKKPFIKKRVQLVEIVAVASEVFIFAACLVLIDRNSGDGRGELEEVEESGGVGIAMLGVFSLAFAAQVCNEWNALYRQVQFLSPDRSSFLEGAKAASVGLLLLVLPSSVLGDPLAGQQQQEPSPDGGGSTGQTVPGEAQRSSNERSWLGQLREMAKASFSRDGEDPSSSTAFKGKRSGSSSVASQSADSKAKGEWRPKSKALYKDLEAIFSNR
ncbi:unnamed protein product [Triticum turgidum subsp. durum]|uniref:Bacterial Ig-like domain-containing protein n=1 Tax=Triticum turgidum subsp. durum TaxID=4567 RepID=A0A9R1RZB2_TRITD|nr:unnamed protein product [Triticum turgidum subsp. durum]